MPHSDPPTRASHPPGRPDPGRLLLSTAGQIVSAVPYLLGFRPERSGVLICLRRRKVGLTMRFDLHADRAHAADLEEIGAAIRFRLAAERADTAVLVLYDPPQPQPQSLPPGRRPGAAWADELGAVIRAERVRLPDVIGVSGGRFWSYGCRDESCCPSSGRLLPGADDPEHTAVAARFVAAGVHPEGSRSAIEASLRPGRSADPEQVRRLMPDGSPASVRAAVLRWRAAVDRYREAPVRPAQDVNADDALRLVADVQPTSVRDEIIGWCADDTTCDAVARLCRRLAPRAAQPYNCQLLAVLAWAAYCTGEGALAGLALDTALRADPQHSMARLLLTSLHSGIRPEQLREVGAAVREVGAASGVVRTGADAP